MLTLARYATFLIIALTFVFPLPAFASDIVGVVRDSASALPVDGAEVRLLAGAATIEEVETDSQGRFSFATAEKGTYRVVARKDSYVESDGFAQSSVLTKDSSAATVTIQLWLIRTCSISGHVLDSAGRPVRDRRVVALTRRGSGKSATFAVQGEPTFSNDLGGFRLFGLPPGRYSVAVVPSGEQEGEPVFAPVYFPGVSAPDRAQFFDAEGGESRGGVDFTIASEPGGAVEGMVSGMSSNWRVAVSLFPESSPTTVPFPLVTVHTDSEGRFRVPNIVPGVYTAVAYGPILAGGQSGPEPSQPGKQGHGRVEVAAGATANAEVPLRSLNSVSARVVFAEGVRPPSGCMSAAYLSLLPDAPMPVSRVLRVPIADGALKVDGVPASGLHIFVDGLSGGCYVQGFLLGDKVVPRNLVDIQSDSKLTIVLGVGAATISGVVTSRTPGPGQRVALVRDEDYSLKGVDVLTASADERGAFRFAQVPPGDYRAVLASEAGSQMLNDPEFWKGQAFTSVRVEGKDVADLSLESAK